MTTQADDPAAPSRPAGQVAADPGTRAPEVASVAPGAGAPTEVGSGKSVSGAAVAGEPVPAKATMITTLTGIRAVTALWVVIDHLQDPLFDLFPTLERTWKWPVQNGHLAIEIFFVLSGFIMAHNYADRMTTAGRTGPVYRKFLWARVARIYPVHLTTLLMVLLLSFTSPSDFRRALGEDFPDNPVNFLGNLLMLQAVPPFRGYDAPSWSLSCEFGAYLLMPVLAMWAVRRLSPRAALIWAVVVLVAGVLALNATPVTNPWKMSYSVMWLRIAVEFTAGVLLWAWWRAKARPSARWDVVAVGCLLFTVVVAFTVDPEARINFVALPFLAIFVLACASASGPFGRLLCTRPMVWTGNLTYSLYLVHCVTYLFIQNVLPYERVEDGPLVARIGWFGIALVWIALSAVGMYYLVEEPGRKLLMRWWVRRHPPTPAGTR